MGTWNAFYVRAHPDGVGVIREFFPAAPIETSAHFIGVHLPEDAYVVPEQVLARMSARLATDVIWLGVQSTVDAFQFHHWSSGEHVRALAYGCFQEERTWERAEGEPEPWEREVFFGESGLNRVLEYSDGDEERHELQRIWREGEIRPGRIDPALDSRDCAHQVAAHFGFPHYS